MAASSGDRAAYFPGIEKKHGLPISHWLDLLGEISDHTYAEQMSLLQEGHGFSRSHANAVVLYARGSTTSRRYRDLDEYLAQFDEGKQATVRAILAAIMQKHRGLETVIAWNTPMVKSGAKYIFGVSVHANHITIAPWDSDIFQEFLPRLTPYETTKLTIKVPVDWKVDKVLLQDMVTASMRD